MSVIRNSAVASLSVLLFITIGLAQSGHKGGAKKQWVDSVYNQLNEDERIGQLFMVAAYSGGKNYNEELITKLLAAHQVGGLIFMQGGPIRQAVLTNRYQRMAQVPLLVGMDAEWGLGMRLDSVKSFPRQMMLGAARDTNLVYKMAAAIAVQCKRLGVHIDFAPDVDVNNNPANPVINSRSFGENKYWVALMGRNYARGLQQNGVIACAKHFPGHGNTSVDSHKDLPLITSPITELDTLELYPFKKLIAAGVKSVMVAHLEVPALDTAAHVPTSLSRNTVTGLLKDKLGFGGLVFTDALGMQGVTKYFPAGETDLRAFEAGNDVLLFSQDVPTALARIKNAIDSGIVPQAMLETSVKKILAAKYDAGLAAAWKDIDTTGITGDLNMQVDTMRHLVAKSAVTLVNDDNQVLNKLNESMRIGYIGINADSTTPLYEALQDRFLNVGKEWLPKGSNAKRAEKILESLPKYDAAIVAIHNLNFTPGNNYGLNAEQLAFLQQVSCKNNVMIVLLGNAYAMQYFCGSGSTVVAYEDDTITERTVADVLLKKIKAKGRLPVTACVNGQSICPAPGLPVITGEPTHVLQKTLYPADAGVVDQKALDRLDMFMARNIANGVFPGCRVLAARNGKVFYDKAFGYLEYNKAHPVDTNTIYDMASCTKVLATLLCVMRLYEQGKLDINKTVGDYLPAAKGTNKAAIKISDLLLHQAGLKSYIPFFHQVLDAKGNLKPEFFSKKKEGKFTLPVTKDIYLRNDYPDSMWNHIYTGPLENLGKYVYSDLDFYFLAAIVQEITGKTIDKYADEQFYKPMGLKRITFNPINKFDTLQMAPTEVDNSFRKELVYGYVHDPGSAMLGGVAGHAGLFASAEDVAAIFQMLLNKGVYGTTRYFKPATVDFFSTYHSAISHRGLGWDKPLPEADAGGPAGDRCSALAFGHQGFTGTCAWADPANGIVFVFLSNRVYPTAANVKINKLNVRTVAQDYIYEAMGIPVNHDRPEIYKSQVKRAE